MDTSFDGRCEQGTTFAGDEQDRFDVDGMMPAPAGEAGVGGRRMLAAVAFADVVNYTSRMAADEAPTHAAWMAMLDAHLRPRAAERAGAIVKSTGDGVLVRFGSVVDAIEWGLDVQRGLAVSTGPDPASALQLRISVHLGDVIATEDDIFGDGVNVAARLLEHGAPGAVVMSEAVHDLTRGSASRNAVDLGFRNLKSFERPVRLFELPSRAAEPVARPGGGGLLPTLAVLPLADLGGSAEDAYFADGIVEDIVVSLAGLGELMVVSWASTLAYRGRVADPREVGRALGVRYVLMGTLRRSPRSIRVSWQLCGTHDCVALWSETSEVPPGELFALQDHIVAKVAAGIAPRVRASELGRAMRKRPESHSAYEYLLRAMHIMYGFGNESFDQARGLLDSAMREDPFFAMPFAWAAWWHVLAAGQGRPGNATGHARQAGEMATRAIELDGSNAQALAIRGHIKSFLFHEYEAGLLDLEQALSASPSNALARTFSAASLAYTGEGAAAVRQAEQAIRLSPLDPMIFFMHSNLCLAHYADGRFAEAARFGRLSEMENPRFTANKRLLAGSLVANGDVEEARSVAARMLALEPGFSVREWGRTLQPFRDPAVGRLYEERLLAAGLPA